MSDETHAPTPEAAEPTGEAAGDSSPPSSSPPSSSPASSFPPSSSPASPPDSSRDAEASPLGHHLEGVDHRLDPRSIHVARLTGLVVAAILATVSLPVVVGVAIAWPPGRLLMPAAWLLVIGLLTARAWWWPAKRYHHASYRLDPRQLVIRRGVWWRTVTYVPRSRVQHTDVSQGPIQRHFGLGTLVVHTAGTQFAAVPLGGLAYERAVEIRDLLIDDDNGGSDDAV